MPIFPSRGVLTDVTSNEVRAVFAEALSQKCESGKLSLADWRERVAPKLIALVGLRELCSKNLGLLGALHNLVREHPDFEMLHEPILYLYCFRFVPNGLAERQRQPEVQALLDQLNEGIVEALHRSGLALVMTSRIRGRVAIRMSLPSPRTSLPRLINTIFEAIALWGRLLNKNPHFVTRRNQIWSHCHA